MRRKKPSLLIIFTAILIFFNGFFALVANGATTAVSNTTKTTPAVKTTATAKTTDFKIEFENLPSFLSGVVTIKTKVNFRPYAFEFYTTDLSGKKTTYSAIHENNSNEYAFSWNTLINANGIYKVGAIAKVLKEEVKTEIEVKISNVNYQLELDQQKKVEQEKKEELPIITTTENTNDILELTKQASIIQEQALAADKEIIATVKEVNEDCLKANFNTAERCRGYMNSQLSENFSLDCLKGGVNAISDCETYIKELILPKECRQIDIKTKTGCREIMKLRYGKPFTCEEQSERFCNKLIDHVILGDFINNENLKKLYKIAYDLNGNFVTIKKNEENDTYANVVVTQENGKTKNLSSDSNILLSVLPIKDKNNTYLALLSEEKKITDSTSLVGIEKDVVPLIFLSDYDNDGLPDDLELRLKTNPNKLDSNGNNKSDLYELKQGEHPSSGGKVDINKDLSPIDQATIKHLALEQPRFSGNLKNGEIDINKIVNEGDFIKITGKAKANEVVSLITYSILPILNTVQADKDGIFSYTFNKKLLDGKHQIYAVIYDAKGKITIKSEPYTLFIENNKIEDEKTFLNNGTAQEVIKKEETSNKKERPDNTALLISLYLAGAFLLVVLYVYGKKEKLDE
ncbi:MAG: thrombospondin type 3 repeat-containing protein [Planctomycetes bacterium]|nr:thrombospondin type 3 repeat-containing protein [Planctomycetota bacterium]